MKRLVLGFLALLAYTILCIWLLDFYLLNGQDSSSKLADNETINESSQATPNEQDTAYLTDDSNLEFNTDSTLSDSNSVSFSDTTTGLYSLSNRDNIDELQSRDNVNDVNSYSFYAPKKFGVYDTNGATLYPCTTYSTIYEDNERVKVPYPCRNYGRQLKKLLDSQPTASVLIVGHYEPEESRNLGLQRAAYVKSLLQNIGIAGNKIEISEKLKQIKFLDGVAQGGIEIIVDNIDLEQAHETMATVPAPVVNNTVVNRKAEPANSRTFVTGFQGDIFYGDKDFENYVNTVSSKIAANPKLKVVAYAYTDKAGNAKDNYELGKQNLARIQLIMRKAGIPAENIVTISMGEKSRSNSYSSNKGIVVLLK